MSAYTKPILRFGLITPAVFNCLLLLGAVAGVNKLSSVRAVKMQRHQEQTERLAAIKQLETKLAPLRKDFEDHKRLLQTDPGQLFTKTLDIIVPKYKDIELERSGLVFPLDRGKMGRAMQCDISRVKSTFQGGIGPMQETLLQVEALMPQAFLEDIKISRKQDLLLNHTDLLNFEITHTCWKTGEAAP